MYKNDVITNIKKIKKCKGNAGMTASLHPFRTAVKPAAVQKNTVKPAAIEINVRVYYNDYGNHRNNTEETRF